jgi:hypothetical protein
VGSLLREFRNGKLTGMNGMDQGHRDRGGYWQGTVRDFQIGAVRFGSTGWLRLVRSDWVIWVLYSISLL